MSETKVIHVVCAVVVDKEDRFLVVRRPPGSRLAGMWEFPGGKIERDELPEVALRRELQEELDLDPSFLNDLIPLPPVTYAYEFAIICLAPFVTYCAERLPITLLEHTELRWVGFAEVSELAWAPADVPILEELRMHLLRE